MRAPISRRAALRGSVAASLGLVAGVASVWTTSTLSANDRRLVELTNAYEALERRCDEHSASHRHLTGDAARAADAEFDVLTNGMLSVEAEVAETPADTLVGIIAKARMFQVPTARAFSDHDHIVSLADDIWRLHTMGRLAHG